MLLAFQVMSCHVIDESEAIMVPPEWPVLSPTRSRSPKRGPGTAAHPVH